MLYMRKIDYPAMLNDKMSLGELLALTTLTTANSDNTTPLQKTDKPIAVCTVDNYRFLAFKNGIAVVEMFDSDRILERSQVVAKIKKDILVLLRQCEILVIVTNNVFEDGIVYDEATMEYIRALGEINAFLARLADEVVEVVAGIPITMK